MKQYTAEELNALSKGEIVALLMQTQKQNAMFMEQIATMQAQRLGRKTERLECLGQGSIFNEAEAESEKDTDEPETEEISYTRTKRKPGKLDEMLKGLSSRIEDHELSDEELSEMFGENGWKRLPDDVYRKLEYHPATKEVVEHHVAVYAARKDDRIVRAPHPAELLVHSVATPSLVAAIMNAKYTNVMPLYRIAQEMERYDVRIPVPTMANWVIRCAERYLYPVADRLHVFLQQLSVLQADETTCKVNKDGRPANSESRMFVYRSREFEKEKVIVPYDYRKTRNAEHVANFLGEFSGILVSDAYSGYHALDRRKENIQVANCWAHARRSFADAFKSIDPDTVVSENTRKGLQYSVNQEQYLKVFLSNCAVPIDNSACERAIRPFCVGRANWHMIDSEKGTQASAVVYSIVETAKANSLKPYEYLKYLLTEMPKHMDDTDFSFLDDLLP